MIRLIAITTALVLLTCAHAKAASEFCAGTVLRYLPIHTTGAIVRLRPDTAFGYQLRAEVPRTISGVVYVYAGDAVYQVGFNDVQLKLRKKQKSDPRIAPYAIDYVEAQSDPLYFRFDSPKRVYAVWVASAGAGGVQTDCPTMPVTAGSYDEYMWDPEDGAKVPEDYVRSQAPADPPKAVFNHHVDVRSCSLLFKVAQAPNPVSPAFPKGTIISEEHTALVKVLLDASGKVADAWIFGSSGAKPLDDAALVAARATTYVPGQFLCAPVPGVYMFRADFRL
jgi:TonB family protein